MIRRIARWIVLAALLIAAGFLGWWTYRTTRALEAQGERSIIDSTVLLTREKVDRVEQLIISNDNAVRHLVNPDDLEPFILRWNEPGERISPTVRSVAILDESQRIVRHVSRGGETAAQRFRVVLQQQILPALHLDEEPPGAHRHLHERFGGEWYLLSVLSGEVNGRRHFIILEADLEYVRDVVFGRLFDDPSARDRFNVVDESGALVFGKALARAGEFVVSRRFPTTLYKWRLSLAPQSAPELEARARRRRVLDVVLVTVSLGLLVAGLAFFAYSARNEQRLNQLKSDFIATVSHELKTPLSLIRMFGEMLNGERVPTDAKRRQYLDIIVRESERLTALIENVLDFAKVERGKAAYEFHRANLGELVSRAVELFRYRLDRERPEIVVQIGDSIPDSDLDERALQLLLFNLLDNAVKYAGQGAHVFVRVRTQGRSHILEVEDEGAGIDDDDAKRVFERFFRGRSARAGSARGSGIGLALVKHIAEAHGGDVVVTRATSRGALFRVRFPIRSSRRIPDDGAAGAGPT